MTYQVKIIYPKEEALESNKLTERTFNEYMDDLEAEEVIKQYEQLLTEGYSISVNFFPPQVDKEGSLALHQNVVPCRKENRHHRKFRMCNTEDSAYCNDKYCTNSNTKTHRKRTLKQRPQKTAFNF